MYSSRGLERRSRTASSDTVYLEQLRRILSYNSRPPGGLSPSPLPHPCEQRQPRTSPPGGGAAPRRAGRCGARLRLPAVGADRAGMAAALSWAGVLFVCAKRRRLSYGSWLFFLPLFLFSWPYLAAAAVLDVGVRVRWQRCVLVTHWHLNKVKLHVTDCR